MHPYPLVERLGGPAAVARLLSESPLAPRPLTRGAVAMWLQRESIPHAWRPAVALFAVEHGLDAAWTGGARVEVTHLHQDGVLRHLVEWVLIKGVRDLATEVANRIVEAARAA